MNGPDQNNNFNNDDYDSDYSERNFPRKEQEKGEFFWNFSGKLELAGSDFECARCLKGLQDPVTTYCCKKIVCRQCFNPDQFELRNFGRICPLCNKRLKWSKRTISPSRSDYHFPCSKLFNSVFDSLQVRCIEKDCQMEMKYKDFDIHYKEQCRRRTRCEHCSAETQVCDNHACAGKINADIRKTSKKIQEQKEELEKIGKQLYYEWW